MSQPCRHVLVAVRRAQLQLLRQHLGHLKTALEGLPTVASQLDYDSAKLDEALADDYLELRERIDSLMRQIQRAHFRTCGVYAQELRRLAKE